MHPYVGSKQIMLTHLINAPIITVIIEDMPWDLRDVDGQTYDNMIACFEDCSNIAESLREGESQGRYRFMIKNVLQFKLKIDFPSAGLSFCPIIRTLNSTKERSGLATIESCNVATIAGRSQICCAANLQTIFELLGMPWTFSVALYMFTHTNTSYLDVCVQLHLKLHCIINVHVRFIPVHERHTAAVLFDATAKMLDVLHPSWNGAITGVSTEGERQTTGRVSAVATRFQQVGKPDFIRIFCGAHQLDLVIQALYSKFGDEDFYNYLTTMISYLRRQQNLTAGMKSEALKVAGRRWESMHDVSDWFTKHRFQVIDYLEEKKSAFSPPPVWWLQILIVARFSTDVTITFRSLQGCSVTVTA